MARNDHSPNAPAEAASRNRGLMSVARTVTFQSLMSGMRPSSSIAIEYGSSPVQQPALQMRSLLPVPRRSRIRSGSTCALRISKLCFSRKKYVSPIVSWPARVSMSRRVKGEERSFWTYSPGSRLPCCRAAEATLRARSPHRSSGKCRPMRLATNALSSARRAEDRVSLIGSFPAASAKEHVLLREKERSAGRG